MHCLREDLDILQDIRRFLLSVANFIPNLIYIYITMEGI